MGTGGGPLANGVKFFCLLLPHPLSSPVHYQFPSAIPAPGKTMDGGGVVNSEPREPTGLNAEQASMGAGAQGQTPEGDDDQPNAGTSSTTVPMQDAGSPHAAAGQTPAGDKVQPMIAGELSAKGKSGSAGRRQKQTDDYKKVLLNKHGAVKLYLEHIAPTYQALTARGRKGLPDKTSWVQTKQEEVVTQFGKKELARYAADDIRAVSG